MAASSRNIVIILYLEIFHLFQIHQKLKKVVLQGLHCSASLQSAYFDTKPSVAAVLPEKLPTFSGVMYYAELKLEHRCIEINKKDD